MYFDGKALACCIAGQRISGPQYGATFTPTSPTPEVTRGIAICTCLRHVANRSLRFLGRPKATRGREGNISLKRSEPHRKMW